MIDLISYTCKEWPAEPFPDAECTDLIEDTCVGRKPFLCAVRRHTDEDNRISVAYLFPYIKETEDGTVCGWIDFSHDETFTCDARIDNTSRHSGKVYRWRRIPEYMRESTIDCIRQRGYQVRRRSNDGS